MNAFELCQRIPPLAEQFDQLMNAQHELPGLDANTKHLINIVIQTAIRNPRGVGFHTVIARRAGASRQETLGRSR